MIKLTEDMILVQEHHWETDIVIRNKKDGVTSGSKIKQQILENQEIVERVKQFMKKYDELILVSDYSPQKVDIHAAWIGTHEVLEKILTKEGAC